MLWDMCWLGGTRALLCCMHVRSQVKENETDEERKIRLEMEALAADENERREQVHGGAGLSGTMQVARGRSLWAVAGATSPG